MKWSKNRSEPIYRKFMAFSIKEVTIVFKDKSLSPQIFRVVDLPYSKLIDNRLSLREAGKSGDWLIFNWKEILFYRSHDTNETESVAVEVSSILGEA